MVHKKTWLMDQLEVVYQADLGPLLSHMHYGNGMTYQDIADYFAISPGTVSKYMRLEGVNQRSMAMRLYEMEHGGESRKVPKRKSIRVRRVA